MPKDTKKENVPPRSRYVQKKPPSAAVIAALAARTQTILTLSTEATAPTAQVTSNDPTLRAVPKGQTLPSITTIIGGIGIANAKGLVRPSCMGRFCLTCNPRAQAALKATVTQSHTSMGPTVPNESNPYTLRSVLPPPQGQFQPPRQPQALPLPHPQPSHSQLISRVPKLPLYPDPGVGAAGQTISEQPRGNPLGIWPLKFPPLLKDHPKFKPLLQLDVINQFYTSAGIWPPTLQIRPEYGLHDKVASHPSAKHIIGFLKICQISTSFKIGTEKEDGFRWAILLLPYLENEQLKAQGLDRDVEIMSPLEECAWLLDPCARMEGQEFLQYLSPQALMMRRRLDLRPRVNAKCEFPMNFERLIWRMENWDPHWTDVLCCSVTGVKDPRSLALGTGSWVTAVYQLAFGARLSEFSPAIMQARNVLGSALESMSSRELGLPFLHPARLESHGNSAS